MKILHIIIVFLLGAIFFVPESAAQLPTRPLTRQEQAKLDAEELNRRSREMRERFEKLRREQPNPEPERRRRAGNQSSGRPASAYTLKPSEADRRLVAPDDADVSKYAELLRQPNTGLVRLLSDQDCRADRMIAFVSSFCVKYRNLYGASVYSFRIQNYMPVRFGDVIFKNGTLSAIGKMTLGFLTDLGKDVELKDVSAATAGAKYVFDFVPPGDVSLIEQSLEDFQKGVEAGGFKYHKYYQLEQSHVYLLRSVAYQNDKKNKKDKTVNDDLFLDERKDVIIAFQVVRISGAEDGGVTLLWRELQRKDAAKIVMDDK